jgi:HK97 family phage portal protein
MWNWLARLTKRSAPPTTNPAGMGTGMGPADAYRRQRDPGPADLVREFKAVAWACANMNANVCAGHQPKLYVHTAAGQAPPRCLTRPVGKKSLAALLSGSSSLKAFGPGQRVEEVVTHPLLDLLANVNPVHNAFDLFELTQLYQEVTGVAYWHLEFDGLGTPSAVWPLASQAMRPIQADGSSQMVDYYLYRVGGREERYEANEVIAFRMPDVRDPYLGGMSPTRAAYEQIKIASEYTAFKQAKFSNHAVPDALLSPDEVIGEEERDRLEMQWNAKMRRGGAGRVLVAESKMNLQLLQHSMGDMAALADGKANEESIALAYGVPQPYLTGQTNLANLQAARQQHAELTIRPRIRRRDQKLNEQLVPLYDASGRLFLHTDDPVPEDQAAAHRERVALVQAGIITVDEARAQIGLPPKNSQELAPS